MHRTMLEKDDILKWTDRESGVKFDACVNNVRGLRSTALLGRAAAESSAIVPLVQVLKALIDEVRACAAANGGQLMPVKMSCLDDERGQASGPAEAPAEQDAGAAEQRLGQR